jgi:hypothetical protein
VLGSGIRRPVVRDGVGRPPFAELRRREPTVDYCRHDDVDLDGNEDHYLIECNQCGCWWRCYGRLADVWSDFTRYARADGTNPSTVNIRCSPVAWPDTDGKVEYVGSEYSLSQ